MNIEFYISMQTIICLSIFLFWFFLPIIVDLKKTMAVPEKRHSRIWTLYGLITSTPMILINLIIFLIVQILIKIVDLLNNIAKWIIDKVGFNAKH